jgi:hypothetical protein
MSVDLFQLLPAVYRTRDAQIARSQQLLTAAELAQIAQLQALPQPLPVDQQAELDELIARGSRGPLESLLMLIGEQLEALAYDMDQRYDDQFIETCAPWVIPYIGDLIGYQAITGIAPAVDNQRAAVAETISLRRRKGTVLVMEQLARDVTGWGAHAVEQFQVLADTQYMKHLRHKNLYSPDLRTWKPGVYGDTGFDATAHRVDVRNIALGRGRYSIQNIGVYLWSMIAESVTRSKATEATESGAPPLCYRFHPLGMDVPLFHRALSQGEQITTTAAPENVPDALLRRVLCADMKKGVGAVYYGEGASLALYLGGQLVSPYELRVAELRDKNGDWVQANLPDPNGPYTAVIDPESGRIALASAGDLSATWFYGANANIGGGEYARSTLAIPFLVTDPAFVVPYNGSGLLQDTINHATSLLSVNGAVAVEISGLPATGTFQPISSKYEGSGGMSIALPAGATLELRAAAGSAQTLLLDGPISVSGDADSSVVINGLVIAASDTMKIPATDPALLTVPFLQPVTGALNALATLTLNDATLVPGWSLHIDGTPVNPRTPALAIASPTVAVNGMNSILGGIRSNALATVALTNCIVDATSPKHVAYSASAETDGGAALTLNGCTVVGKVHGSLLTLVTDSIFWASKTTHWSTGLIADRKQQGCVRFSFLPFDAITPPPYHCVTEAIAAPTPYFIAMRYGQPGYLKLMASTDASIRRGAEDGGEMGVYHFLLAPQRESDLQIRLHEYTPVGLEIGFIYQN